MGCPGRASHALARGGMKESQSKAARSRVANGSDGKARWRVTMTMGSEVWLECASHMPGRASHVPACGGPMETRRKVARSGEVGGDDGKACLVTGLTWKSISSF